MKQALQKGITISLLSIFVWSCFGLGLGMIGHSMMDAHASHEMSGSMIADAHECCVVPDNAAESQTAGMGHHQMDPVIIEIAKVVKLFATIVAFLFFAVIQTVSFFFSKNYAVHWARSISYFALHLQRLFGRGILHPKTW